MIPSVLRIVTFLVDLSNKCELYNKELVMTTLDTVWSKIKKVNQWVAEIMFLEDDKRDPKLIYQSLLSRMHTNDLQFFIILKTNNAYCNVTIFVVGMN